jgi:hypothetical protein
MAGYVGLPIPSITNRSTFVKLTDSLTLKFAGLSALSDPMVRYNGRYYPSIFSVRNGTVRLAGEGSLNDGDRNAFQSEASYVISDYAVRFSSLIGRVFGVESQLDLVRKHVIVCFSLVDMANNRHAKFDTFAPFYWIEPTSLFRSEFRNDVGIEGFGCIAYTDCDTTYPMFEKTKILVDGNMQYDAAVVFRSARTSGLIMHLLQHPDDGLGGIIPRQFSDELFHMTHAGTSTSGRRAGNETIDSYMWGRGHCDIPSPAEMLYIGEAIGVRFVTGKVNGNLDLELLHLPSSQRLLEEEVVFSVGHPSYIGIQQMLGMTKKISRERTHASDALLNAKALSVQGGIVTSGLAKINQDGNWFSDGQGVDTQDIEIEHGFVQRKGDNVESIGDPIKVMYDEKPNNVQPVRIEGGGGGAPNSSLSNPAMINPRTGDGAEPAPETA